MIDFAFSFLLTLLGLFVALNTKLKHLAVDKPNARSLHSGFIPRTGGLAIMSGVLVTWLFIGVNWIWLALPMILVGISFLDDIRGLKARWRLLTHVAVCAFFLWMYAAQLPIWISILLLFAMVWMVNLYNFMDGSDGLAGGMAVFGFSAYGVAAYLGGFPELTLVAAALVGANLAFLVFNFHPARIFMGDGGSVPQGFLMGAIGFWGWQQAIWPVWFPILVFSPFIMDATVTLLKRLFRREKVWEAHKSHYYQRLVQMGWGHKKTAIIEYALMFLTATSAILTIQYGHDWVLFVLGCWVLIYFILIILIDKAWSRSQSLKSS